VPVKKTSGGRQARAVGPAKGTAAKAGGKRQVEEMPDDMTPEEEARLNAIRIARRNAQLGK
jgi:hypothetical protein